MTRPEEIEAAARLAFAALRTRAREDFGGNTQPLLVVYAAESVLRRLAISEYARKMVLKGGMLMAAQSVRRMTRDTDLSTHGVDSDEDNVRAIVTHIAELVPDPHDGVVIDPASIRTQPMREDAEDHGVRCKLIANLGRARISFALDLSFGDPELATVIELKSLIDRPPVRLAAYPLAMNLAEKVVTAMQRRETSTRDRDFADLWVTNRLHRMDAAELRDHISTVAAHRGQPIISMAEALAHMPDRQQSYAAMVQRMSYLHPPPERWTDVLAGVTSFIDPLLENDDLSHWDPETTGWVLST